ncbi:unnamed protein product [Triticum turgidum subsp. durum]|uniref:Leucine-rich repeat-containing N-terminal plant-type domain-containing protein n=1 Tax=Triticum turgidum subsp. durum TaxID=4567 RepID=A0A9R1QT94_TRITD|nr:unnamed protein product [Triticum turgidum subsp. durum]
MKHLHLVGLLLLSFPCLLLCAGIRREAEALVKWKASLASADESLEPWSLANSTSLCTWTHITCDLAGHITKLEFDLTNLSGTLDELDFSAFPHMEELIMFGNGLHGTVPAGIGNLMSLVELHISLNPYLTEIGNLTSLEALTITSVTLTGSIPPTIGMLTKLRPMMVDWNTQVGEGIPMEIGNMTELNTIYLRGNYLEGHLPGTISHLVKLQELYLSENQLGGHIFPELGNSSLLDTVKIAENNFSGLFPSSICVGGALRVVDAGYNGFIGIHHLTFQHCTTLQYVDFTANNIVAELRDCFTEHPGSLVSMAFSQNQMSGTLLTDRGEDFLCNRTSLNFLDLSSNALHGGLPKCFWDMQNLRFMDLSNNSFSGVVPFSMTCQDNLRYLLLASNQFTGTFPLGLKKCKTLFALDLGGNNFSGRIPSWVSMSLPELNFLRLSSNMFDGIIPHEIFQFQQLRVLDLSKNKLTGPIPDDFTNLTGMAQEQKNIAFIYPDRYLFRVRIQIIWKNVDYVYYLLIASMAGIDLSGNYLSQEIPKGITALIGLRYLNLSGNHLSGCIPEDIGNIVLLESLDLSRNQLSGKIPQSLAALKSISVLNFSSNRLSGRIPTGDQLRTLTNRSIYSNNPGLCGFPLEDCINSSTPAQTEKSLDEDREALWSYCFVAAGFIFGFWLYWGIFLSRSETWRCAFYQYVDNMQGKVTKKVYSCISRFWAGGSE